VTGSALSASTAWACNLVEGDDRLGASQLPPPPSLLLDSHGRHALADPRSAPAIPPLRARGRAMRALPGAAFPGFEDRRGEAPGVRSSAEAAHRDRAPRGDPRLPGLRPTHARRLPRGYRFAGPIWPSGSGRRASISTLSQLAPEERTAQVLADLFGATAACGASVPAWVRRKAEALAEAYRRIGGFVAAAPVRCLHETGFRIAGTTRWRHTASTPTHTFYRADEPRSAMPELAGGVAVHDHWRAYYSLENVDHAFCNAHLLRELQAVCERDKEPWAEALRATLLDANEAVRAAKREGAAALAPETIKAFEERYWAAVREGLALHRSLPTFDPSTNPKKRKKQRPAHNLLIRFKTFKEAALRFLADFPVPFTQPRRTGFEDDEGEDQNLPAASEPRTAPPTSLACAPRSHRPESTASTYPKPWSSPPNDSPPTSSSEASGALLTSLHSKTLRPPRTPKNARCAGPPWQLRRDRIGRLTHCKDWLTAENAPPPRRQDEAVVGVTRLGNGAATH
jgi:hypothetical protein